MHAKFVGPRLAALHMLPSLVKGVYNKLLIELNSRRIQGTSPSLFLSLSENCKLMRCIRFLNFEHSEGCQD